jgi:glycosyltransferase involved in cell wall biosynthesis
MKIGVDAGCLGVAEDRLKVGVYQLVLNLLKELSRIDKKNEYWLYSFGPIGPGVLKEFGRNVKNKVLKPKKGWLNLRLSWEFLVNKPDLFLGFGQALPLFHPLKSLVFVYDLAFEYFPECYPDSSKKISWQTKRAAQRSDWLAAISQSTKNDLIELYGVDRKKIRVIYPGVNPIFKPQSRRKIAQVKKKYQLNDSYFLFVGSLKPSKNLPRIIEAFARFLSKTRDDYQLILAGSDFWIDKEIASAIKKLKLEKKVKNLGYVSRGDLPALYSGAEAFVSPSLYEGFGLPLVEAMACGAPVVTSNIGPIPEVVGKAGILVDPHDIGEITQAMKQIEKPRISKLFSQKGLNQAKKFSWQKAAKQLLGFMEKV